MSLVIFLLPILIESENINFLFSNIAIDVEDSPKSIQIAPKSWSSSLKVDNAEERGVGIKLSTCNFNSLNKFW